jgi:hypothetical protein
MPQDISFRDNRLGDEVMADVMATVLLFLSISVLLAHAIEAYWAS